MSIRLIDKIEPKNDAFTGMVDADQVLGGGGSGTLPDATVAESNVTQHEDALSIALSQIVDIATTYLKLDTSNGPLTGVVEVTGADARVELNDDDDGDSYLRLQDASEGRGVIAKAAKTGDALLDIDPKPLDGTNDSSFRFFRLTNTSGNVSFQIFLGDGTGTTNARIGASGLDTYFCSNNGEMGVGTTAPSRIIDANDGSGNIIADGYDAHPSFASKKDAITEVPNVIAALVASPPKVFKRIPYVSAYELRQHAIKTHLAEWIIEFGGVVDEHDNLEGDDYRDGKLKDIKNKELLAIIDAEGDRLREKRKSEHKWQREYTGLIIDDENLENNLPNVIIKDEQGDTRGWSLDSYIGYLHKAIIELKQEIDSLKSNI